MNDFGEENHTTPRRRNMGLAKQRSRPLRESKAANRDSNSTEDGQRRAELMHLASAALNALILHHDGEGVPVEQTAAMARDYARLTQRAIDQQEVADLFTLLMGIQNPSLLQKPAVPKPIARELAPGKDRCA